MSGDHDQPAINTCLTLRARMLSNAPYRPIQLESASMTVRAHVDFRRTILQSASTVDAQARTLALQLSSFCAMAKSTSGVRFKSNRTIKFHRCGWLTEGLLWSISGSCPAVNQSAKAMEKTEPTPAWTDRHPRDQDAHRRAVRSDNPQTHAVVASARNPHA